MQKIESKLKKNMPALIVLIVAGAMVYALPYLRYYYYDAFLDAFNMTNTQSGLCGTLYGTFAAIAYLIGGVIADKFPIRKLLSVSLIVTGGVGLILLMTPSPIIIAFIHAVWGVTTIMTFWPALMKTLRSLASKNEQSKVFGFFEGGRGVVNAIYLGAAVVAFGVLSAKGGNILGIKALILTYSVIAIVLGVLVIFLLRNLKESEEKGNDVKFKDIGKVLKYPETWLMAMIVFTTYFMNMSYYYIGPYATAGFGASTVVAVIMSSASQYVRPFTAIGAGVLGDRINSSSILMIAQVITISSIALLLLTPQSNGYIVLIIVSIFLMYVSMYSTQSMHFAVMEEANFPPEVVGTVIGMVCCLGYLPEVICPFIAGRLLDTYKGTIGYKYYFMIMAAMAVLGLIVVAYWRSRTKEKRMQLSKGKKEVLEEKDSPALDA